AGMTRPQFDDWWRDECRRRLPKGQSPRGRIDRDLRGIPRIHAENELDLFFAFGYATAQDRLFQLDFLRRKARGRLAEILGTEALESDKLYRTIGLSHIAEAQWDTLPDATRLLMDAYADGV